ncbi:MAG: hypothetical protein GF355_15905 [Candidatus Eisenbacteria bacterium]|nr:hypothetical protein [Candidatus Eisenbacteria bacterium]
MQFRLIEDDVWRRLLPLTWLRPVYELRAGAWTVRRRWQDRIGRDNLGFGGRPEMAALLTERYGARSAPPRPDAPVTLINGAWLPPSDAVGLLESLGPAEGLAREGRALALRIDPPLEPERIAEMTATLAGGELPGGFAWREVGGAQCLDHLWDLLTWTEELLASDLQDRLGAPFGEGTEVKGDVENPDQVSLGAGVRIAPGAVIDTGQGPVVLEAGCQVMPHTWVRGPVWAGPGCLLLGDRIGGGVVAGPECRLHGEIVESVVLGYSNKAHAGYVGNSYLAEWVNLGAMTTTSNLKNTYGVVRIMEEGRQVSSDRLKLGAILGDHVKTAIGTLLTTGCVAGVAAHVFGGAGLSPKAVPSFAWGVGPDAGRYDLERFLRVVRTVLERRGQELSPEIEGRLRAVYESTQDEAGGPRDR